ncbi:hypothetical protein ES703_08130 [subsurface metagenome]
MAEETTPPLGIDTWRENLQKLSKKHLVELVKSLDIKFKDRTKANKERIISHILDEIETKTFTVKDIEKELGKEKYKVPIKVEPKRLTKKDLEDFRKEVLSEIDTLNSNLSDLRDDIRGLDRNISKHSSRLTSLEKLIDIPAEKFPVQRLLKMMRKLNLDLRDPKDFDSGLQELLKSNAKLSEFIKMANVAITMSELDNLVKKKITWPEDLDLFYNVLKTEFEKVVKETGPPVPIYQMKQVVSERLAISEKDFEKQLISCFKKGWLTLDLSSPISEEQAEFLEVDGRKYYLIRSLQRE